MIPILQRYVDAQKSPKKDNLWRQIRWLPQLRTRTPSEEEQEDNNGIEVKRKRKPEQKTWKTKKSKKGNYKINKNVNFF